MKPETVHSRIHFEPRERQARGTRLQPGDLLFVVDAEVYAEVHRFIDIVSGQHPTKQNDRPLVA